MASLSLSTEDAKKSDEEEEEYDSKWRTDNVVVGVTIIQAHVNDGMTKRRRILVIMFIVLACVCVDVVVVWRTTL
jgi:hypothetical protein